MTGPVRITGPFLDVLQLLFAAYIAGNESLHGWAIMKATKRSGPTVYGILDRLEDEMGWIEGRWEQQRPDQSGPRKRFYTLTPTGVEGTQAILRQRRPDALRTPGRRWQPAPRQSGAQ